MKSVRKGRSLSVCTKMGVFEGILVLMLYTKEYALCNASRFDSSRNEIVRARCDIEHF